MCLSASDRDAGRRGNQVPTFPQPNIGGVELKLHFGIVLTSLYCVFLIKLITKNKMLLYVLDKALVLVLATSYSLGNCVIWFRLKQASKRHLVEIQVLVLG